MGVWIWRSARNGDSLDSGRFLLNERFRLIIGRGSETQRTWVSSEELGISKKIQFAGWLTKVGKFARACSHICTSFTKWGYVVAILEAMSWSISVCCNNHYGMHTRNHNRRTGGATGQFWWYFKTGTCLEGVTCCAIASLRTWRGRKARLARVLDACLHPQLEKLWINSGSSQPGRSLWGGVVWFLL